jgi:glycosyltransferase involved in cell wall biosynthesis
MQFDPGHHAGLDRAGAVLNRYPMVLIQHEFGIFGPDEGIAIVDLVEALEAPVMVVLHTVPLRPTQGKRQILQRLAGGASAFVVPSHSARVALEDIYDISADSVAVIPHGSSWRPMESSAGSRSRLLTWGLLGPGKGIERAIEAVSFLRGSVGDLRYRVVGQTHPNVVRQQGYFYRDSLEGLIRERRLHDVVQLDEGYKSEGDLHRLVTDTDVVVIPYDNSEQISSGVLTEAVAAGKPVVATEFPHATELLGSGAGIVVGHDDPKDMAHAIETLLTDDVAYRRAVGKARSMSRHLSWTEVGRRYHETFDRLSDSLAVG